MKNLRFSLQEFQHVTRDYQLMLLTLFFMRAGQFMLLPFLAIYLSHYSNASPLIIGITVGIGPLIYGAAGVNAGIFVDRFGAKNVMVGSLFISAITVFSFFYAHSISWCFLLNALTGATRAFFDISTKSYGIANLTLDQRRISFSLRFMVVNSAAAIGPVMGAFFAANNSLFSFQIIGVLYFFLSIFSLFKLRGKIKSQATDVIKKSITFNLSKEIFLKDSALRILVLINFMIFAVFSQIDSTLPQYLHSELKNGVRIYALLLIVNASICVALQLIVSKLTKDIYEYTVSCIGMISFAISYFLIGLFLQEAALILAMVILTLSEITIMPLNDLLLARIAPVDRIGTYYGIAGVAMLGLGVGPMIGGFIYQYFSAKALFLLCGCVCLMTLFLYKKLFNNMEMRETLSCQNAT
jgi:MFS family permease